ncbi:MAG TPA: hypothetical protein VIV66_17665, partial [Pyrinomonadaceae bacterium]
MNRLTLSLLAIFVAILLGSALIAYVFRDRSAPTGVNASAGQSETGVNASGTATPQSKEDGQSKHENRPLLWDLFGPDSSGLSPASYATWETAAARIGLRFSLAAFLAALLAF